MDTIENTLFLGKVHLQFPTLDSTNRYALNLISKSNPSEGTLISTDNQSAGRGQIGSKWESEAGKNLTLSIILYPQFLIPSQQFLLNQAISLGLYDFLSSYLPKGLKIKWPNDLYVEDRKIAGILLQNTLSSQKIQSSVAGLGTNINQTVFSKELPNASSLALENNREYALSKLFTPLCLALERRYLQLKSGRAHLLQQDYLQNLFRFMEEGLFRNPAVRSSTAKLLASTPPENYRSSTKKESKLLNSILLI